MSSMKRYLYLLILGVVTFIVITIVKLMPQSPEEVDRQEIASCWDESKGAALTAEKRQIVIGACEALEKVFQFNYGIKLSPGAKDL